MKLMNGDWRRFWTCNEYRKTSNASHRLLVEQVTWTPACTGDSASIWDLACIRSFTAYKSAYWFVCHRRWNRLLTAYKICYIFVNFVNKGRGHLCQIICSQLRWTLVANTKCSTDWNCALNIWQSNKHGTIDASIDRWWAPLKACIRDETADILNQMW